MNQIDCTRAKELIPLHVADDTDAARAREVSAHLAACAGCRALAAGFVESRSLLAEACAPPEFGAEFYAGIRSAVLAEIRRDRPTPSSPSSFIATLFARRLAYAASLAVAIIALALALQHARRDAQPAPEIAQAPRTTSEPTAIRRMPASPDKVKDLTPRGAMTVPTLGKPTLRRLMPNKHGGKNLVNDVPPALPQVANLPRTTINPAAVATEPNTVTSQSAPEVARIEIQTADPNIR
ncbi:MAG: zf-HC2 domain-containing protein, partial [Pyrinomonadaceae bacterium]